jgi:hypothetical protein
VSAVQLPHGTGTIRPMAEDITEPLLRSLLEKKSRVFLVVDQEFRLQWQFGPDEPLAYLTSRTRSRLLLVF